jgi:Na+(H+)/acetate symporter ActP
MYITYKKAEHIHIPVTTTIKIVLLYIATLAGIGVVVEFVSSCDFEIARSVAFDVVMAVVMFEF